MLAPFGSGFEGRLVRRGGAWLLALLVGLAALVVASGAGAAGAALPRPVGAPVAIDVPSPAGDRLFDVNPFRAGTQVVAQALEDTRTQQLRLVSVLDLKLLAESPTDGFVPRGSLGAGWRAFLWGEDGSGQARLWAPAFDSERSFLSLDPPLVCDSAAGAATPLAGPFQATIPAGAKPGGQTLASPAEAFVFGDPGDAARGVQVATAGGAVLGVTKTGANVARGGFGFAGAVFAYGTAGGEPTLWTPELFGKSTRLLSRRFVACHEAPPPPAQGTITVSKTLVPAADPGRFDLRINGEGHAAGIADGGTTGPVTVPAGEHTVAETAAAGTDLADYTSEISCTEDTNPASPLTGPGPLTVTVTAGDDWQCRITNERRVDPGSLTVQSSPEAANAATKTVGALGGTVEATGADGTRYSLWVPPGALTGDVAITVTPTAVAGLEAIATAAPFAVELAPSGLTFATPARLTITPAGGAPAVDFAASWQDASQGVEILPLRANPDGTLVADISHFSGVASIQATVQAYNTLLAQTLSRLPEYNGWKLQLTTHAAGLPGTEAQVANDVQQIYTAHILPFLQSADAGIIELRLASQRLQELEYLYAYLPIGGVPIPGSSPPATLDDLLTGAADLFTSKATGFLDRYTISCDGAVNDLADWIAIPLLAVAELNLRGATLPVEYCVRAAVDTISWPNRITPTQTTANGSLRGVIQAPGHTPGGIAAGSLKLFPQPTEFSLDATGATFPGGASHLDQITADDGVSRLDFQLDRQSGTQNLVVDGSGRVAGFTAEIVAVDSSFEIDVPVHLTASTGTVAVAFRNPPTNTILPWGQTTNLCVDATDGDGTAIAGETVIWALTGPGSLASPTSTTDSLGRACVDYQHPAGPVTQGDTARIQASVTHNGDTGAANVTLTPDWAHIEIETRLAADQSYQASTNSTRTFDFVSENEFWEGEVRVTVTAPGATPADPPRPVGAGQIVQLEIESGGIGELTQYDPFTNTVTTGQRLLAFTDANGQVSVNWHTGGVNWDLYQGGTAVTTIRVHYPDLLLFGVPGVTATVTIAIAVPPATPPCTPPNCYL